MKKYTLLLLLLACTEKQEKPYIHGDSTRGYTVSYKEKILWSESAADTVGMKEQIIK
jgi:hypothetical protein